MSPLQNTFYHTALIHPVTIRSGNYHKEPAQQTYLCRVVENEKKSQDPKDWNTHEPPVGSYLYPSLTQLDEWWDEFLAGGYDAISHDLESAGQFIICDGLTPLNSKTGEIGRSLCLRFRGVGGCRWWPSWKDHHAAVQWLGKVLSHPGIAFVGHNVVGYDIPILREHGFTLGGPVIDTMVLMSRAYPEFPKGLQFCATLFLEAPAWKRMVKDTDDGAEKT